MDITIAMLMILVMGHSFAVGHRRRQTRAPIDAARVAIRWATTPPVSRAGLARRQGPGPNSRRSRSRRCRNWGPKYGRTAGRFSYRHRAPSEFTQFMADALHQTHTAPSTGERLPVATNVCCGAPANFTAAEGCADKGDRRLASGKRFGDR